MEANKGYTIAGTAEGEGRFVTLERFGHVRLRVEPVIGGSEPEFRWEVPEEQVPSCYERAVSEGIREAMGTGINDKRPIVGLRVSVTGGSYHEVNSSEFSYRIAATRAFEAAVTNAGLISA